MVNVRRHPKLICCVLLALGGIAVLLSAPAARSAVIWTFYETSCVGADGSNCTFQPPSGLAQLTLPDINASGAWSGSYNVSTHSFTESGDTDFLFKLTGSSLQAPGFHPASVGDSIDNIVFDIAFASSPASLAIAAIYTAARNDVCIHQGSVMVPALCPSSFGQFLVATDVSLLGCDVTRCDITGTWVLALVPEPSSLAGLGAGLLGLLIATIPFCTFRNQIGAASLRGALRAAKHIQQA